MPLKYIKTNFNKPSEILRAKIILKIYQLMERKTGFEPATSSLGS